MSLAVLRVLDALRSHGLEPYGRGPWICRCPAHEDRRPSLSLAQGDDGRALLRCHAGCELKAILMALRLSERDLFSDNGQHPPPGSRAAQRRVVVMCSYKSETSLHVASPCPAEWSPLLARRTWDLALERARDDQYIEADRSVHDYLAGRGLSLAWEEGVFGVLHEDLEHRLPATVRSWPQRSYKLIAPLHDQHGDVVGVAARAVEAGREPKVLYPRGAQVKGTLFASPLGRDLLAGVAGPWCVVLAEGFTDLLAIATASPIPALSLPGAALGPEKVGTWARDRVVLIALDCDPAGERQVPEVARAVREAGGRVFRLLWPGDAKDACEVLERYGHEGLGDFLAAVVTTVERKVGAA